MGRFETTVPLYAELRPPYPDRFFRTVAAKLGLSQRDALIDLGTGPGLLALGFAPMSAASPASIRSRRCSRSRSGRPRSTGGNSR